MGGSGYVYDQAWQHERLRLQGIETMFDAITREQLLAVGLAPGSRCLEVGLGAGSIARWMASVVGPAGHVVATDLDPRFLDPEASLEVRQHDIVRDELEQETFDLVHSRMVLEHVPERDRALARMIEATRPGGWLVVEDLDLSAPMIAAVARSIGDPELTPIFERVLGGFVAFMTAAGADLEYGPRLPSAFDEAGLEDVYAESRSRLLRRSENDFARLSLDVLREPLIGAGLVSADEVERLRTRLEDTSASIMSVCLVSARGRRPASGA